MNTRRTLKVVAATVLFGAASISSAGDRTWTRKTDMPTPRFGLSASVVDGKIYVIGGGQNLFGAYLRIVEVYDPATDTWATKANMPTARCFLSTSVVNNKIYAIGGSPGAQTDSPAVEEYDPVTDAWTGKADMPTSRTFLSTSVVDGNIYAIGGRMYPGGVVSTVEAYEPETDTWTRKADMLAARASLSTCVVNGKIYAIGGKGSDVDLSIVEEYDPKTNSWTRKRDMPRATRAPSTTVLGGKVYAIGGGVPGTVFATVEEYDPTMNTWTTKARMPTARFLHSSAEVNGKVYVVGGSMQWSPQVAVSTLEEYDPNPFMADLNADEIVNFKDFSMLAKYWYQDHSPLVNYRLSYRDLAVLADYWLTEILPLSLIARWKLDETEGSIAHDRAGDHDGTLHGDPIWQPTSGIVNGALELDGISDYVSTPFVVAGVDVPFSVFAWVKGGAPGQVILSQRGVPAVAWLATDPSDGSLVTDYPGLLRRSLASQTVVTDGQWRRVGLVWDPPDRMLYIDDVEVASDKHPLLGGSDAGFYIGAGSNLDPGTFWSGLLDDVRIYNRAIVPASIDGR